MNAYFYVSNVDLQQYYVQQEVAYNVFATWLIINFPNFKLCAVILWTRNRKLFSSFLGFIVIYQRITNNEPKRCFFAT